MTTQAKKINPPKGYLPILEAITFCHSKGLAGGFLRGLLAERELIARFYEHTDEAWKDMVPTYWAARSDKGELICVPTLKTGLFKTPGLGLFASVHFGGPVFVHKNKLNMAVEAEVATRSETPEIEASDIDSTFSSQYWNLWQLLAWVHSQEKSLVAMSVDRDDPPKLWYIEANYTLEGGPSFEDSQKDVLNHLRSGKLDSYDLPSSGGASTKIDALQWSALKFFDDPPRATVDEWTQETVQPYFPVEQKLSILNMPKQGGETVNIEANDSVALLPVGIKSSNPKRGGGKRPGPYINILKEYLETYNTRHNKDGGIAGADNIYLARQFVAHCENRKSTDRKYRIDLPKVGHLRDVVAKLKKEILKSCR
jgi:hypothetical protein